MNAPEAAARQSIVECYRELARRGLNAGAAGNVSVRFAEGMLITPTGVPAEELREGELVAAGLDGSHAGPLRPSSEWAMHAAVYRRLPAAGAVIHGHPDACVALSCLRRPIPAFHYMVGGFGGDDVPCTPHLTFGTIELGEAAGDALIHRTACLLGSHGMLARGATLGEAFEITIQLEVLARQYLLALSAGTPVHLTPAEIALVGARAITVAMPQHLPARPAGTSPDIMTGEGHP
jgi:L-fuculose-phosphate aldolase